MNKPTIEVQYEVCKTCNGSGRNYAFSHFGSSKPKLGERLCIECYGLAKRPIQALPDAVGIAAPPEAQKAMQAVLELAEAKRAAAMMMMNEGTSDAKAATPPPV